MQISELRWLVAVVEDPNLGRVAERMHVTQPALSRAIRRLEHELGVALFDRVGRRLEPNAQGIAMAQHAVRALDEIDRGAESVRERVDPERGEVRLAFLHTLGTWLVPDLIGAYRVDHPAVRFRLRQDAADRLLSELVSGTHDLLLSSPRPHDPHVRWEPLFDEPLRLAVPADHPLAGRARVSLAEVAGAPFVAFRRGLGIRPATDALCQAAGFMPQIAFEGDDVATVRGLVAAGLGVAVVPSPPGRPPGPQELPLSDRGARRTIGLCSSAQRTPTPAVRAFAAFAVAQASRSAAEH